MTEFYEIVTNNTDAAFVEGKSSEGFQCVAPTFKAAVIEKVAPYRENGDSHNAVC
jgi:hypothetical protein